MLPPWRKMKLEMPETRPFWSGQDTNNVAVSGMGFGPSVGQCRRKRPQKFCRSNKKWKVSRRNGGGASCRSQAVLGRMYTAPRNTRLGRPRPLGGAARLHRLCQLSTAGLCPAGANPALRVRAWGGCGRYNEQEERAPTVLEESCWRTAELARPLASALRSRGTWVMENFRERVSLRQIQWRE